MLKIISKVLLLILIIITILVSYLTFIGVKTESFNYLISENIKKIDKNLNIELNKVFKIKSIKSIYFNSYRKSKIIFGKN